MDHCEGGWIALWGGIVVPDVHFLCYLVRAMSTIARAMLFSSAVTLEIAIHNWK